MSRCRSLLVAAVLVAPSLALAMGFGGTDAPTRIPVPARSFSATVEDLSGTVVEVTDVSFDGEVHITGMVGDGQVAIPFDRITEVRVEPTNDDAFRIAFVKLKDGTSQRVVVERDVPCYGATSFGYYKIDVDKIRRITFR